MLYMNIKRAGKQRCVMGLDSWTCLILKGPVSFSVSRHADSSVLISQDLRITVCKVSATAQIQWRRMAIQLVFPEIMSLLLAIDKFHSNYLLTTPKPTKE